MGFGTTLYTDIYFNRETYNSLYEVEDELEQTNNLIKILEKDIESLTLITEPKKFCSEEDDPICFLQNRVRESLHELNELYINRYKLTLLKDEWDKCHNDEGLAIPAPREVRYKSFLSGDFIHSVEE